MASVSVPVIVRREPTPKAFASLVAHRSVADSASGVQVSFIVCGVAASRAVVTRPMIDKMPIEPVKLNKSPDVKCESEVLVANFVPGRIRSVLAKMSDDLASQFEAKAREDAVIAAWAAACIDVLQVAFKSVVPCESNAALIAALPLVASSNISVYVMIESVSSPMAWNECFLLSYDVTTGSVAADMR